MQVEHSEDSPNQLVIQASLIEKSPLRHTPAGLPACEFKLSHSSLQIEAGEPRRVQCELDAIALGVLANQIEKIGLGVSLKCSGFIARRSVKTQRLRFHVCKVELN